MAQGQIEQIMTEYLKPVYNFVYRLSGQTEEASDITQEVFVKVWKNLAKYDPTKNFKTWIFTIARNTTIDWLRKRKSLPLDDFVETLVDPAPRPNEIFADQELSAELDQVLDKLHPNDKTIIILHHQDDLTFAEIAEIFHRSLNTIKSRYRRALMTLKNHLNPL